MQALLIVTLIGQIAGSGEGTNRSLNQSEVLSLIRDSNLAHRDRLRQLGRIDISLEITTENLNVTEAREVEATAAGGGRLRYTLSPRETSLRNIVICGDKLRWEDRSANGDIMRVGTIVGGTWTHFDKASSSVHIYDVDDVPAQLPIDPRELGSFRVGHQLADLARSEDLISARLINSARWGAALELRSGNASANSEATTETTVVFAQSEQYLPVYVQTTMDGALANEIFLTYHRPVGVPFLDMCTYVFYGGDSEDEPKIRQRLRYDVTSTVARSDCADVRFDIVWEGTATIRDNVSNVIRKSRHPSANPLVEESANLSLRWLIGLNVGFLLLVLAVLVHRRRRLSK